MEVDLRSMKSLANFMNFDVMRKNDIGYKLMESEIAKLQNMPQPKYDVSPINKRYHTLLYDKLFSYGIKNDNELFAKTYAYMFHPDELNAFIAQIISELKRKSSKTFEDAYYEITKNDTYMAYAGLIHYALFNDAKLMKGVCDEWRKIVISDKSFSDEKIAKKLKRLAKKAQSKLCKAVAAAYVESNS